MFAARNIDVSFSNIKLIVDGEEVDTTATDDTYSSTEEDTTTDATVEGDGGAVEISTTDGLLTDTKYGYSEVATFEVLTAMPFLTESSGGTSYEFTLDEITYTGVVQGSSNPSDSHAVQSGTSAFEITAVADSTITFITRENEKNLYFVNASDTADTSQDIASSSRGSDGTGASYTFNMTAGNTYYFYAGKSNVMVAAISIAKASDTTTD
ncbi:MAG: hypothetical protein LUE96_03545 [Lachnospiraceae bacterium]|nr:hypothetical protein [Lachnospiraceae bacterium]